MSQPSLHPPLGITLETRNFRALRRTCWTPSGVCVVVGPNGAGKTTLLTLLEFLRNAYLRSAPSAIDHIGGVYGLRSWGVPDEEPVLVALTVGELRWELQLTAQGPTLSERLGERVTRGDEVVLSRAALSNRLVFHGDERPIADREERLGVRICGRRGQRGGIGPSRSRPDRRARLSQLQPLGPADQRLPTKRRPLLASHRTECVHCLAELA